MPAFTRELTDEEWYTARAAAMSTVLRNIDAKTVKAANGTAGSNHAPAAAVIIGGAGMTCAAEWRFAGAATTAASKHITLGGLASDDYVRLGGSHPGGNRTLDVPALPAISDGFVRAYGSREAGFEHTLAFRYPGTRALIPLVPHNGSTIYSVRLRFKIGTVHAAMPTVPKFRVIRVDRSGNVDVLHTPRSGAYADDGYLDLPTNSTTTLLYEAAAALQWSQVYVPDRYATVDLSLYSYFIDFVEESGPNAFTPITWAAVPVSTNIHRGEVGCNSITLLAPQ